MPQSNARQPPGFKGCPIPSQAPQESNLDTMVENMLLA